MKYHDTKINIYEVHLRLVDSAVDASRLERTISPIGDAIKEIVDGLNEFVERINYADLKDEDVFFADAFIDDEAGDHRRASWGGFRHLPGLYYRCGLASAPAT